MNHLEFRKPDDLTTWWDNLSIEWRCIVDANISLQKLNITWDSIKSATNLWDAYEELVGQPWDKLPQMPTYSELAQVEYIVSAGINIKSMEPITAFPNLWYINCLSCKEITKITPSINLNAIEEINANRCCCLETIDADSIKNVKVLDIGECSYLQDFDLGELQKIKQLTIYECPYLTKPDFSTMKRLEELNCSNNEDICEISLVGHQHLRLLDCWACKNLTKIELRGLPNLEELLVDDEYAHQIVLHDLDKLRNLNFPGDRESHALQHLELINLPNLQLEKDHYASMNGVQSVLLGGLKNEQKLEYSQLQVEVFTVNDMPNVETLNINPCHFSEITISNMPDLKTITLRGCRELESVSLNDLPQLERANVLQCDKLKNISFIDTDRMELHCSRK